MTHVGLERYGYLEEAQRLAYRFLYMSSYPFQQMKQLVHDQDDRGFRGLQWCRAREGGLPRYQYPGIDSNFYSPD